MKLVNVDIDHLVALTEQNKMICFGAGQGLKNFISYFAERHLEKRIYAVCDNDSEKIGQYFSYETTQIPIIGVENIKQMKDIVVVISCLDAVAVYKQLDSYAELREVPCVVANYVKSETCESKDRVRVYPETFRRTEKPLIPKVIHYCWFGKKPIPEQNRIWMESWKKFCPDYEIVEWNEDNYDVTKNQYMYDAYQAKKWGFVPDYARLDIICEHGGFYLDTDVELIKSLDDLRYQTAFMGVDQSSKVAMGHGFGAEKQHWMIKELREHQSKMRFLSEDGSMNLTASPTLQSPYFRELGYCENGEMQTLKDVVVYPAKVLSGKCNYTGRILPKAHTYAIHHYDGSWTSREKKELIESQQRLFRTIESNMLKK